MLFRWASAKTVLRADWDLYIVSLLKLLEMPRQST
jgi:hypothetical protein